MRGESLSPILSISPSLAAQSALCIVPSHHPMQLDATSCAYRLSPCGDKGRSVRLTSRQNQYMKINLFVLSFAKRVNSLQSQIGELHAKHPALGIVAMTKFKKDKNGNFAKAGGAVSLDGIPTEDVKLHEKLISDRNVLHSAAFAIGMVSLFDSDYAAQYELLASEARKAVEAEKAQAEKDKAEAEEKANAEKAKAKAEAEAKASEKADKKKAA